MRIRTPAIAAFILLAFATIVYVAFATIRICYSPCRIETGKADTVNVNDPQLAKTVISLMGEIEQFVGFPQAESRLGWRVLRPSAPEYTLAGRGGFLRTLGDVGKPRIEQAYDVAGRKGIIAITQEPETYKPIDLSGGGKLTSETIAAYDGTLLMEKNDRVFVFLAGLAEPGVRIRVTVIARSDVTADDLRRFVSSLDYGG